MEAIKASEYWLDIVSITAYTGMLILALIFNLDIGYKTAENKAYFNVMHMLQITSL